MLFWLTTQFISSFLENRDLNFSTETLEVYRKLDESGDSLFL